MEKPAPAYRGGEPFVFVSYSHRDEEIVYREIRWLQDQGVNVWYDTHIQAGSEWSDALANAIAGCSRFVFFITPNSVASENCRRELNYAIEEGRSILAVHLRETDVPGGIRLNINNRQAILKHRLDADVYRSSLLQALSNDQVAASAQAEPSRSSPGARRMMLPSVVASIVLIAMALIWLLPREAEQPATREAANKLDASSTAVAVLPFNNASRNDDDAYLSIGLSDELRAQLGRVPEFRIAARSSSIAALDRGMDAKAASETLSVAYLVEGSMRRQGNRLRVSVQLIDGSTGLAVWSNAYERGANELLNVQQDIAQEVVSRLLPDAGELASAPATRDTNANELMLLANYYEQQVRSRQVSDTDTLLEAIDLYRRATELDPESALAYSRLAGALLYLGDIEAAEAPIFKALSINPNLSEVQNTLGEYYWARNLPQAPEAFERAIEINPNNADALTNYAYQLWLSQENTRSGGKERLSSLFRRAVELDPLSPSRHYALGDYLAKDGHFEEVPAVIQDIGRLFDDAESYRAIAWLHELLGEVDVAIAWTIRARELESDNQDHLAKLAELYAIIGDAETALALESPPNLGVLYQLRRYNELIDTAEFMVIDQPDNVDLKYVLAFSYVATGRFEQAIQMLSATGQPDIVLNDLVRSVADIEAFTTLINALIGSGLPDAMELGRSLAGWQETVGFWGEIGWQSLFKSCNLANLDRHQEALEILPMVNEAPRLRPSPQLHDSWCFRRYADNPVYQAVLKEYEMRRAVLKQRLPETLRAHRVDL